MAFATLAGFLSGFWLRRGKIRYHGRMREGGKVVYLCKAHGKLGSMTFAFDLMHLI